MSKAQLHTIIRHLNRSLSQAGEEGLTDGQLLENFVGRRDEGAFELLVWRHGAMVLGTCRRLLRDAQEAEDALQATFLVLARKAGSIRRGQSVGGWLHRVATRLAFRTRTRAAKQPRCQPLEHDVPGPPSADELAWADLRPVLDEEVNRLPEKYRQPVVLCYLEGQTNEEAARRLGCPRGTILSRLARGRERLRSRLTRRGITLASGTLAALLASEATAATLPAPLVPLTVTAALSFAKGAAVAGLVSARAAAWTEGALHAMFLSKLKVITATALVLVVLGAGGGLLSHKLAAQRVRDNPGQRVAQGERRSEGAGERGRQSQVAEVQGILKAVDAAKGAITVTIAEGRGQGVDKTFDLAKDVEVGFGGMFGREIGPVKDGKLVDLAAGAHVSLVLAGDPKKVESILAQGPRVQGLVKLVDPAKDTITVTVGYNRRDAGPEEKIYTVAKDVRIGLDDGRGRRLSLRQGKLGDLVPDAPVTLQLSPDLKSVVSIQAQGQRVTGIVKAVDPAKNTITVAVGGAGGRGREEAAGEEKTYTLAKNAEIVFDDGHGRGFSVKEGKLADLTLGAIVGLQLAADQNQVGSIQAEGPQLVGLIKGLDLEKNTFTLGLRAGRGEDAAEEKTYALAKDAMVLIDDGRGRRFSLKEGKLADLVVGAMAQVKLAVDCNTATQVRAAGPMFPGRLKALDAGKSSITLTTRPGRGDDPGEEKTFTLAPDVRVFIDGAMAKIGDLKVDGDAHVTVRLSMDQKLVRSITVISSRSR
jgi:RNA polymerase sigma factor (sigma-70 family)